MSTSSLPALPCLCASFRRVTRALSQRYDAAMRELGLTITQFTLLQTLSFVGEISQGQLGEILAMDSTTLTRSLKIMSRHGWVATRPGTDRRERLLSLTPKGMNEFNRALPHWRKAQAEMRAQLGEKRWQHLTSLINEVTSLVAE